MFRDSVRRKKSQSKSYMTFSSPGPFNILNQMLYGVACRGVRGNEGKLSVCLCALARSGSLAVGNSWLLGLRGSVGGGAVRMVGGSTRILGHFCTMRRPVQQRYPELVI